MQLNLKIILAVIAVFFIVAVIAKGQDIFQPTPIKQCSIETKEEGIHIIGNVTHYKPTFGICEKNGTMDCINGTKPYLVEEVVGQYVNLLNTTICQKETALQISQDKKLNWEKYGYKKCAEEDDHICCEMQHQSNGDGKCQSGEGFEIINPKTMAITEITITKTSFSKDMGIDDVVGGK